jgi:hypothetical protein
MPDPVAPAILTPRARRTKPADTSTPDVPARAVNTEPTLMDASQGAVRVARSAYGRETEQMGYVVVPVLPAAHARVRIAASRTVNLGDNNFAKIEVSVELPCLPETSEVARVMALASLMVEERLDIEMGTDEAPEASAA